MQLVQVSLIRFPAKAMVGFATTSSTKHHDQLVGYDGDVRKYSRVILNTWWADGSTTSEL